MMYGTKKDPARDVLIMRLTGEKDTFTKTTQSQRFRDLLACQTAFVASIRSVKGISDHIDSDNPPKNNADVMSRPDAQEWAMPLWHIRRNIRVSRTKMHSQ
jgi:hypothetical protein